MAPPFVDRRLDLLRQIRARKIAAAGVVAATMLTIAEPVVAGSGFELRSQSASTLGSAQAGMTAAAGDVSYLIFNPAALAYGLGTETAINLTGLFTNVAFDAMPATTILGTPISGNSGGNAGTNVVIPNLYLGADLLDDVRIGVAIAPRFGLGSYWSSGWFGRYYALDSELRTIDIVPTISWRPSKIWSIGFALDIEYAKIKNSTAIDFGTFDQLVTGGLFGGAPADSDGSTSSSADSWGVGVALGVIYEPRRGTRLAFDYHSKIRQQFSGNASFSLGSPVGAGVAAATGAFAGTGLDTTIDMPAMAAIGVYHELNADWTLMADAKWTDWSAFSHLQVNFANPAQPPVQTTYAWRDSWFLTLGTRYRASDVLALRFGVAYDTSPTRDATRNPVIPDTNSTWAAIGLEWRLSPRLKLDVAYGHIIAKDASISQSALAAANALRGNLLGTIEDSRVDYLALQLAYRF